jgi:hypothetical protein
MKGHTKGFTHILVILLVLCLGLIVYSVLNGKPNNRTLPTPVPEKTPTESIEPESKEPDVKIDNSKTVFLDRGSYTYAFFESHDKFLVSKSKGTNNGLSVLNEIGYYTRSGDKYEPLYKATYEELEYFQSPNKQYVLIADVIQDPSAKINYKLVKKMTIFNLGSRKEISVPFPNALMLSDVLWKLNENKVYITARKPEGLDYSFKWYYEFNLNSSDFKLIATSDNFVLNYGNSDKNFAHFILNLYGFDSTGKNIIGVGQAPEDPHLLTVWRIDPENSKFTKLYDYNTDEKLNWPKVVRSDTVNNKLTIEADKKLYSMDLLNGKITDLNKVYEDNSTMKVESSQYEYLSYNYKGGYITLKNISTNKEVNYPILKNNNWNEYTIIMALD